MGRPHIVAHLVDARRVVHDLISGDAQRRDVAREGPAIHAHPASAANPGTGRAGAAVQPSPVGSRQAGHLRAAHAFRVAAAQTRQLARNH